ncbi:MAG: host attachment protein [Rhodospirillaceae bacterium]|nr:host attachment protein [Rhodospirillaceae bacterium]
MSISTKTTWLAVGDGANAQFYAIHAIPLRLTRVPASALKASRKTTQGAEHKPQSLHTTHVGGGHGDHQRHEDVFVEHIAQALDAAAHDGEYDEVIVVLPPKALAHFRKVVAQNVQKRIKKEINGDWTHLAMPDLERHLAAELP